MWQWLLLAWVPSALQPWILSALQLSALQQWVWLKIKCMGVVGPDMSALALVLLAVAAMCSVGVAAVDVAAVGVAAFGVAAVGVEASGVEAASVGAIAFRRSWSCGRGSCRGWRNGWVTSALELSAWSCWGFDAICIIVYGLLVTRL